MKNEKTDKVLREVADLKMLPKGFRFNREDVWDKINDDLNKKIEPRKKIFTWKKVNWRECLNWAAILIGITGIGYFILANREQKDLISNHLSSKNEISLLDQPPNAKEHVMKMEIFETKDTATSLAGRKLYGVIWNDNTLDSLKTVNDSIPALVFIGQGDYSIKMLVSNSCAVSSSPISNYENEPAETLPGLSQDMSQQSAPPNADYTSSLSVAVEKPGLFKMKDSSDLAGTFNWNPSNAEADHLVDNSFLQEEVEDANISWHYPENKSINYFELAQFPTAPDNIYVGSIKRSQPEFLFSANSLLPEQSIKEDRLLRNKFWGQSAWEIEKGPFALDINGDGLADIDYYNGMERIYHSSLNQGRSGAYPEGDSTTYTLEASNVLMEVMSFKPNSPDLMKEGTDSLASLHHYLCCYPYCRVDLVTSPTTNQRKQMVTRSRLVKLFDIIMKMDCANSNRLTIQIIKGETKDNDIQVFVSAWNGKK